MSTAALRGRLSLGRCVAGITLLALLLRLVVLGTRVAHFDEARVAYWTLHYANTGTFKYRFIIHGPFIQHVNAGLFGLLGPTDWTARLPVAIVGGLLPLTVLLFRAHLRDTELIGAALLLAFNPVLLYYSRFLRSSILVAAFAFAAFGLLVRAHDTHHYRYLHGAAVLLAFAFAAKENAAVYVLVWLGLAGLLIDHALTRPTHTGLNYLRTVTARVRATLSARQLARFATHLTASLGLFLILSFFFYAPRSATPGDPGFWQAIANPTLFPATIDATVDAVVRGYGYWFDGPTTTENLATTYARFLGRTLETLAKYAGPLVGLAIAGFLAERYGNRHPRPLVMAAGYWGAVSLLGYPLGTDIYGAWLTVNILIPLAIPAGVGLALIYRSGHTALQTERYRRAGLAAVLLVLVAGQVAGAGLHGVYLNSQTADDALVQYAQPRDDLQPLRTDLATIQPTTTEPLVVFYGRELVAQHPPATGIEPTCSRITRTLPLQWYLAINDRPAGCAINLDTLVTHLETNPPAIVIARPRHRDSLDDHLTTYETNRYHLRTSGPEILVYTNRSTIPS